MKKIFILIFAIVFYMTACTEDILNESSNEISKELVNSREKAYDLAVKVIDSFKSSVSRSLSEELIYPDYYGGMYIDESGVLNVLVKDEVNNTRSVVTRVVGSEDVVLHSCLYSYSELLHTLKCIDAYNLANPDSEVYKNFKAAKLDDINNKVVVELRDCSNDKISAFKNNVVDSPIIVFEQTTNEPVEHGLRSGSPVYWDKNGSLFQATMGYRAMLNNVVGWVTAAHAYKQGQSVYNLSKQEVGRCKNHVYQGSTDAAFCQSLDSGYAPELGLIGGASLSKSTAPIVVGMAVNLYGSVTGVSVGSIANSSFSFTTESGIYLSDVAVSDYYSEGGDSGGPIVYTQNGINYIVGIHHGKYGGDPIVIKESNIRSQLGAAIY